MKYLIAALCTVLLMSSCKDNPTDNSDDLSLSYQVIEPQNPKARADRVFGINISESREGFQASFQTAQQAGVQVVELNIPWNAIETSRGRYLDPWDNVLAATAFYAEHNISVLFSLAVINTVSWEIPDYLKNHRPDSETFITAFNNMLNWFFSMVPEQVKIAGISIGNEVDLVLQTTDDWNRYTLFAETAAQHIHKSHPSLPVGVKTTVMNGVLGTDRQKVLTLNRQMDAVMLNYYPQNEQFQVNPPDAVHAHFAEIVNEFSKPVWVTEAGYQSGSDYCNSSLTKQAQFYHNLFTAWDEHSDHIKLVLIDWLHDQSPETINDWKQYYGDDPALVEYLSTLGLRHYDETEKPAWRQVMAETHARGWN